MHDIRALAIDFSGTLAWPGPNPDASLVASVLADLLGRPLPAAFREAFDAVEDEVARADRRAHTHTAFATVIAQAAARSGADVPDPVAAAEAVFAAVPDAAVDPEAAAAVRRLHRRGWRCVLACNTERSLRARKATLTAAGIAHCFADAVLSCEIGYRKPHPRFYAAVVAACGVPAEHILFVGDNLAKDVFGPRAHGFQSVHVPRADRRDGVDLSRPDTLRHISELPDYLGALGAVPV
ncbi:HAD family hydrolase [Yinghuangia seranimata]|uniref:HAD family hydrolase n=1 Tax=Yinghuangia seranimata TaxID=408067 RepID=UPI00248CD509|nr:HAD family hydrolase [Yinghuangia seranimata]MDI2124640.1 HAD family hydrolase [Yinghuangia seranimata]